MAVKEEKIEVNGEVIEALRSGTYRVAHADQAAASLTGVTVGLLTLVPPGRLDVIAGEQAAQIRYGFELEQRAERIMKVEPPNPFEHGERR